MKKNLVLILCLSLAIILIACSSDKNANKSAQATNKNQALEAGSKESNNSTQAANDKKSTDEKKETDIKNTNSMQSTNISTNEQVVKDKNNSTQKTTKVNSEVKLYEGAYWDERCLADVDLNLKKYCEVVISNVTNTSFDFTVYEVDRETKNRKVIFLTNTAVFAKDGKVAVFHGNTYTLNFTFPSITEIKVSGFEPLEGNTFLNNKIPGHECS